MAIEQWLRAGLVTQLLAGDEPRCFWTPERAFENDAFRAERRGHGNVLSSAASIFAGEAAEYVDAGAYRWTFTRIVHKELTGVLVSGVPTSGMQHRRLAALPNILEFSAGRIPNAANLHRLMELVLQSDPLLFTQALLFASEGDQPFLLLHDMGTASDDGRSWTRWPLERLFGKRRAALITNVITGRRGFAIPFTVAPCERYVVVVVLADVQLSSSDRDFLKVLECVPALAPKAMPQRRVGQYDHVEAELVPVTPRLSYFGGKKMRARLENLVSRRGWEVSIFEGNRLDVFSPRRSPYEILLIDGAAMIDALAVLRSFRRNAPTVPILYFGANPDPETEVLVDACISNYASDNEVFAAIKNLVRELPARRREQLEVAVSRLTAGLSTASSYEQLARAITHGIVALFGEWAVVHLFDASGDVHHAEFPMNDSPLMPEVPMTFISGYAVMKTRVDEDFFAEVCGDSETREALARLQPRSGAAIPLSNNGEIIGTFVVLSTERDLDLPDFEALSQYAQNASQALAALLERRKQAELHEEAWTHVSVGPYDLHVFHSLEGKARFLAAPLDRWSVRIEADNGRGGTFNATLNVKSHTLAFEAVRFAEPLQVAASGPVAVAAPAIKERTERTISLRTPSVTLISDNGHARGADVAATVEILQRGLREGARNPALHLAEAAGARGAFIAITSR